MLTYRYFLLHDNQDYITQSIAIQEQCFNTIYAVDNIIPIITDLLSDDGHKLIHIYIDTFMLTRKICWMQQIKQEAR